MSKIIFNQVDIAQFPLSRIPLNGYVLGFDSENGGILSKKDKAGNITPIERDFGSNASVEFIFITYGDLLSLVNNNSLSPGSFYLITDFRTRHIIPATTVVNLGDYEAIYVQAISNSALSQDAYSVNYPKDTIKYELVDSSTAGGDKGRIIYRKDENNNSKHYDWRNVKFRRWISSDYVVNTGKFEDNISGEELTFDIYIRPGQSYTFDLAIDQPIPFIDFEILPGNEVIHTVVGTEITFSFESSPTPVDLVTNYTVLLFSAHSPDEYKRITFRLTSVLLYTEYEDNGKEYRDFYTFNDSKDAENCYDNEFANVGNDAIMGPVLTDQLDNNVILTNGGMFNNKFGVNCLVNTIYTVDKMQGNNIAAQFVGNIFIGGGFNENTIDQVCSNNTCYGAFISNVIGKYFIGNTIDNGFIYNKIANDFSTNILKHGFHSNNIPVLFKSNTVGSEFNKNNILARVSDNELGDFFTNNTVHQEIKYSVIGSYFKENDINIDLNNITWNNVKPIKVKGTEVTTYIDLTSSNFNNYDSVSYLHVATDAILPRIVPTALVVLNKGNITIGPSNNTFFFNVNDPSNNNALNILSYGGTELREYQRITIDSFVLDLSVSTSLNIFAQVDTDITEVNNIDFIIGIIGEYIKPIQDIGDAIRILT